MKHPLRFEPLPFGRFAPDREPFRARGLVYAAMTGFAERRFGKGAIAELLGEDDPYLPYFGRIFVATADYDLSPVARLTSAMAARLRQPPGEFLEARSRRSAADMIHGMWKPLLKTSSPEAMAERLFLAFNRFFEPSAARAVTVAPGRFEAELSQLPASMNGVHMASTAGFVPASLELAGAKDVRLEWAEVAAEGHLEGVPTERARFVATWR